MTTGDGSGVQSLFSDLDYQRVLDTFSDAVVAVDERGRIIYMNSAAERALGWPRQELLGEALITIVPPRLRASHRAGFDRYLESRSPRLMGRPIRLSALRRDGTEWEMELTLSTVIGSDGTEVIVGSLRDLSDRVELERQLGLARYLSATAEAAVALASAHDAPAIAEVATRVLVGDFGANRAEVWLRADADAPLERIAHAGAGGPFGTASMIDPDGDDSPIGVAVRTGSPARAEEQHWLVQQEAAAAFPISWEGETRGAIAVYVLGRLDRDWLEAMGSYTSVVAASLRRADVLVREQEARESAEASRSRLQFLSDATARLASSLDAPRIIDTLADLAVPYLADWFGFNVLDDQGTVIRMALRHSDPSKADAVQRIDALYGSAPLIPDLVRRVADKGVPELYSDITERDLQATIPATEYRDAMAALGVRSAMFLPLRGRRRTLGVVALATAESGRRYGPDELSLALELVRRAALAFENATLYGEVEDTEHRLRDLIESLDTIVWESDPETTRFRFVSERAEDVLGFDLEAWSRPGFWTSMIHDEDAGSAAEFRRDEVLAGRDHQLDYRVMATDGRLRWMRDRAFVVRDERGKVLGLRGLMADVTELKRAEQRLDAQFGVAQALAESATFAEAGPRIVAAIGSRLRWKVAALWCPDTESGQLVCLEFWHADNAAVPRFEAATREARFLMGKPLPGKVWESARSEWIEDVTVVDDFFRLEAARAEGLHGGFAFPITGEGEVLGVIDLYTDEIVLPDEELIQASTTLGSQIGQFINRREAENELRFQKALLESLSEATIDGILMTSGDGERVLSFNNRVTEILGVPPDVLAGSSAAVGRWMVQLARDPERLITLISTMRQQPDSQAREEVLLTDGRAIDLYTAPLRSENADHLGRAWYIRDITERKRAERALVESRERFASLARTLQRSLLPPLLPEIRGIEVAAVYRPADASADVGGDFYDLFHARGESWGIVMGDVCGKGAEAAALTALARYTVRAAAVQTRDPQRVLRMVNEIVLRHTGGDRFCTLVYGRLTPQPEGARIMLSCGGHPLPLVIRTDGTVEAAGSPGTLLGVFANATLGEDTVFLRPGEAIVFYTDGVTDARGPDGAVFGDDRFKDVLARCAGLDATAITERIRRAVLDFSGGRSTDDVALLALRVSP